MPQPISIHKKALLEKLTPVTYKKDTRVESSYLNKINMSGALLAITDITPEHEFALVQSLAEHLLLDVPKPDEINLENE